VKARQLAKHKLDEKGIHGFFNTTIAAIIAHICTKLDDVTYLGATRSLLRKSLELTSHFITQ